MKSSKQALVTKAPQLVKAETFYIHRQSKNKENYLDLKNYLSTGGTAGESNHTTNKPTKGRRRVFKLVMNGDLEGERPQPHLPSN